MPPPSKEDLWSSGRDETVEVNQRALIDKILARYSGEHTIFRELLQNADDAGAEHVQIKLYSQAGLDALDRGEGPSKLPDVKKDLIQRYVVCNDGIPFRAQDWLRLKKIAEGNPDEEKIGAFGVGFYSLWSICDDPFVESGDKWMGFYWKDGKDQLMARSGDLPPAASASTGDTTSNGNPWTTFTMGLREPTLLEGPLDLARFFITSLTFMRTMRQIEMLVDDVKVLQVSKDVKGKQKVVKKGLKATSAQGMMNVTGVDETGMIITAKVMNWLCAIGFTPPPLPAPTPALSKPTKGLASLFSSTFFNRSSPAPSPSAPIPPPEPPENPYEVVTISRDIQTYQADIKVSVSAAFGRELERATKKPPPARMPASLVFSREADHESEPGLEGQAGPKARADVAGVFAGLIPPLDSDKGAKVFIGQATGQTTGVGGHLSARFIPTVERESIDLVDRHVSHWNRELLWVGGYLCRLIYELEMQDLQSQWAQTGASDQASRARILAQGLHAMRFFGFKATTPSVVVGQEMESSFFLCANDNKLFPIVSSVGILPISQVRLPSAELQKFLTELPVVAATAMEDASRVLMRLRERSLLREVAIDDVIKQLGNRPLTEKEMTDCLLWWQTMASMEGYTSSVRSRLLDAAIVVQNSGKIIPLSIIQTFVKPQSSSIPTDMPLPSHTMPYTITKDLKGTAIYTIFGWTELSLLQYIAFLVNPPMSDCPTADPETDVRSSPAFAERVLSMLGRAWQSISANQQTAIGLELEDVSCIPTKTGFKKPGEAYFEKNLLFDDLPTIAFPKNTAMKGGLEKALLAIGVRKTVDLQLVFSRLVGGGSWTCQDLMKYLVSVKDTLTSDEMARLRQTAAFPLAVDSSSDNQTPAVVRQKPHQLYEPIEAIRSLGLPILDWGEGKWKSSSDEAKMLFTLGLRRFPPVDVLLGIASGRSPPNEKALQFLLSNMQTHYLGFDPKAFSGVAFIPATSSTGNSVLAKPGEVYTNSACAILGFSTAQTAVASTENAAKLRIPSDPPMEKLVQALLATTTKDIDKARRVFEYMATQLGHSVASSLDRLQDSVFIPVKSAKDVTLVRPSEVYFSSGDNSDNLYQSAFTFVDMGERANVFLRYCGVRSEPSVKDIARLLMNNPGRMLQQAGNPEKYLEQLRLLATNWSNFDATTRSAMRGASFVLASQRLPTRRQSKKMFSTLSGGPEDEYVLEWVLCKASDAAIIDNITLSQYFGGQILAAPEENVLEKFYEHLGSRSLSSLVRVDYIPQNPRPVQSDQAKALRRHVLQRLTIFLAENRRRHSEYTVEWLSKEGNFNVIEVQDLKARYTYRDGKKEHSHSETLYATAQKGQRNKAITLTVSLTAQPDEYDIASALCGLLLKPAKADDALLLNSILTTPLMALKKRGYNVDRILNLQREERLRVQAETKRDREQTAVEVATSGKTASDTQSILSDNSLGDSSTAVRDNDSTSSGKPKSLLDRLRRNSKGSSSTAGPQPLTSGIAPPRMPGGMPGLPLLPNLSEASGSGSRSGSKGPGAGTGGGSQTTKRPTDMDHIRNTVQQAIDASRPEMGTQISDSRQAVNNVSESQNDYCDTSAEADIVLAVDRQRLGLNVWIPRGVQDAGAFLEDKLGVCERFAREVLLPIGTVFRLSSEVINIFWDHGGPLIAFNRGGTIFCNARYYNAWHEQQVQAGITKPAFISWYFSIAHELAHNLESAHNSAHEFYFSSIAEEYLTRFVPLLQTPA